MFLSPRAFIEKIYFNRIVNKLLFFLFYVIGEPYPKIKIIFSRVYIISSKQLKVEKLSKIISILPIII